mmetsp:Transcript_72446/g.221817  ORF Transcript_72446/g.221817 Transcript_72446/m.221817 type:complete len:229 (+) Transcript_72446:2084-2770(+)
MWCMCLSPRTTARPACPGAGSVSHRSARASRSWAVRTSRTARKNAWGAHIGTMLGAAPRASGGQSASGRTATSSRASVIDSRTMRLSVARAWRVWAPKLRSVSVGRLCAACSRMQIAQAAMRRHVLFACLCCTRLEVEIFRHVLFKLQLVRTQAMMCALGIRAKRRCCIQVIMCAQPIRGKRAPSKAEPRVRALGSVPLYRATRFAWPCMWTESRTPHCVRDAILRTL